MSDRPGAAGVRGRQDWLSEFDDAAVDFSEAWRDVVTDDLIVDDASSERVPRALDHDDLAECLATAVDAAGIGEVV